MVGDTDENLHWLERSVQNDDLDAHTVQVFNEPCQIPALKEIQKIPSIVAPAKEVAKLFVKICGSPIQVVELL